MRRLRTLLGLVGALCLSACFSSEAPLYAENAGGCPFRSETAFGTPVGDVGGAISLQLAFTMVPDGALCVQTEGMAEPRRVLFVPLEEGWYVAQEFKAENDRYYYGLVQIDGDRVSLYQPNCGDFTPEALTEVGVASPFAEMFQAIETMAEEVDAAPPASKSALSNKRSGAAAGEPPPQAEGEDPSAEPSAEPSDGSCTVTTRAQIDTLFRSWIQLGRPPQSYGDRMPVAAP